MAYVHTCIIREGQVYMCNQNSSIMLSASAGHGVPKTMGKDWVLGVIPVMLAARIMRFEKRTGNLRSPLAPPPYPNLYHSLPVTFFFATFCSVKAVHIVHFQFINSHHPVSTDTNRHSCTAIHDLAMPVTLSSSHCLCLNCRRS